MAASPALSLLSFGHTSLQFDRGRLDLGGQAPPHARMFWSCDLAFPITPKSGPLRAIDTLLDASRAMTRELPAGYLKRPHWREAGWAVIKAVDSGQAEDIKQATELLVRAVDSEGWLQRSPKDLAAARLQGFLRAMEQPLRSCIVAEARRATLKLIPGSKGKALSSSTGCEQGSAKARERLAS
jgi:hypothetical protein